jgi:hypothetical protein
MICPGELISADIAGLVQWRLVVRLDAVFQKGLLQLPFLIWVPAWNAWLKGELTLATDRFTFEDTGMARVATKIIAF